MSFVSQDWGKRRKPQKSREVKTDQKTRESKEFKGTVKAKNKERRDKKCRKIRPFRTTKKHLLEGAKTQKFFSKCGKLLLTSFLKLYFRLELFKRSSVNSYHLNRFQE